jgi:hypothetical protein
MLPMIQLRVHPIALLYNAVHRAVRRRLFQRRTIQFILTVVVSLALTGSAAAAQAPEARYAS